MILSVERAKALIDLSGWTDEKVKMKLDAIEQTIRAYTNNNFQNRHIRSDCTIIQGDLWGVTVGFASGDTIQITESQYNSGLYTIATIDEDDERITVEEGELIKEHHVLVTKVVYPADVVACAVNLLEWEVNNRGKVGIQSETLSRHSVTYFNMDGANQVNGYPASLLGCLKPYRKARC